MAKVEVKKNGVSKVIDGKLLESGKDVIGFKEAGWKFVKKITEKKK